MALTLVVAWVSGCGSDDSENTPGAGGGAATGGASAAGGSSAGGTDGSSAGGTDGSSAGGSSAGGSSAGGSSAGGSSAGGSSAGGSSGSSGASGSSGSAGCGTTQCTNCMDDDGDGKVDAADLQCTGAADNDENSYGTGIPGDNVDPNWQDCFFDGDSGAGNDGCRYHTGCLTGDKPATDADCIVSQRCIDFCMKGTPNGCDCFGCCSVQVNATTTKDVRLSNDCTPDTINDATKCVPCTKATQCNNDCGRCELCIGKPTLPPDCNTGGTGGTGGAGGTAGTGGASGTGATGGTGGSGGGCPIPTCAPGQQACGVSCLPGCPTGQFCLTGCCSSPPG